MTRTAVSYADSRFLVSELPVQHLVLGRLFEARKTKINRCNFLGQKETLFRAESWLATTVPYTYVYWCRWIPYSSPSHQLNRELTVTNI